jgi:hypothetical protein
MQIFLTEKEVARQIKVSLASLRRWRLLQCGPRFIKVGALVRYRAEDLERWLETRGASDFLMKPISPQAVPLLNSRKSI